MTDPIADYLTRLRNAIQAKHKVVEIPASNLKKDITKILFEKGYILNYKFVEDGPQGTIKVALKYDPVNKCNAIKKLERISSPGLRQYTGYREMPRVINGLGIAIISALSLLSVKKFLNLWAVRLMFALLKASVLSLPSVLSAA